MLVRRPHFIALAVVLALVVLLLKLPGQAGSRVKLAVGSIFRPLFGASSASHAAIEKAGNSIIPRSDLIRQNEAFRRENLELRTRAMQADEAFRENAQLRQLVAWQKQSPWKLRLARVIARDPANWWKTMQIDAGARQGVRIHSPVMTSEGLIGRVTAVADTRSQVVLLGDPTLRLGAMVNDQGVSETGVINAGSSVPLDNDMVDLGFLSRNTKVKPGQSVFTSGDGGIFPRGILIGHIVDLRPVDFGLSAEARVRIAAKLNALQEVWVLSP